MQCVIILAWGQKALFLLLLKAFLFVIVGSENAQRRTIRGRCRAINLDSFLICKTPTSCSMDAPSRWIFQYKPHYPITESSYHDNVMICHNAKSTRIEIEIDGTFPRLVSIVQKSSLMHLSNHEMKKVSRLCNWLESQRSWVAINPKVFAKLHLWWKQVTASWHTNLYHAVPQWYTMVYQLHTYSCILYHNMSKKILWQTISKYSQNVLKYGIVARHTLSMHFRNYVFNVTPR